MIRLTLAALFLTVALGAAPAPADQPNIVYIMVDDAGYGDFGCFGQKKFETPNVDRLAAEGLKFTQHYSGSTVCAPTRCCLMMGVHTGHAFIRGNREVKPEGQWPIPKDAVTIPRILKKAGYATGMFGKWGLGAPGTHADPAAHFDTVYGYNCQRQAHTYYPPHLWSNREKVKLDGKTYSHDLIQEAALKFIRDHRKGPFFCYVPITIPHAAMHAPEEVVAPFRQKFPQFEKKIGRYAGTQFRNPIAAFAGMMTRMDEGVGQVLDLLKELKIDENTIVLFTSDNGPHLEGGHDPKFFDSNGPLRGFKRDLYEGGIRVPLLARWPGKIKAGTTSDLICAHWDMMPTFCDLSGAPTPEGIDGISILPTLLGRPDDQKARDHLYWEFAARGGNQAVRMGKWKGIRKNLRKNREAPVELYDLSQDLGEKKNVADAHPDIVKKILWIMREEHVDSGMFPLFGK